MTNDHVKIPTTFYRSELWQESASVRLLWFAFLLLADSDGYVKACHSALAQVAGIPESDFDDALCVLTSPNKSARVCEGPPWVERTTGPWHNFAVIGYAAHAMDGRSTRRVRKHRAKRKAAR